MIESSFNKETAKLMLNARMRFVLPIIIIVPIISILYKTRNVSYDPLLMFGIVYPAAVILGLGAAYLGAKAKVNGKIGTKYKLTDDELVESINEITTVIKIPEIKSARADAFGLKVKSETYSIWIPKQLSNYSELQRKLK